MLDARCVTPIPRTLKRRDLVHECSAYLQRRRTTTRATATGRYTHGASGSLVIILVTRRYDLLDQGKLTGPQFPVQLPVDTQFSPVNIFCTFDSL